VVVNFQYARKTAYLAAGAMKEISTKKQIQIRKYLDLPPSSIFEDSSYFCNLQNCIYFKLFSENRKNLVDFNKTSRLVLEDSAYDDIKYAAKLGYKLNHVADNMEWSTDFKIEGEVGKTTAPGCGAFWRTKIFSRSLYRISPDMVLQVNSTFGSVGGFKRGNDAVRLNDKYFLTNFKGIKLISPQTVEPIVLREGKINILGATSYLGLAAKLTFDRVPLFNLTDFETTGYRVRPFLHVNVVILPEEINYLQKVKKAPFSSSIQESARLSCGFGFEFLWKYFSLEFYYNAGVQRKNGEVFNEFQFNLGID